MAPARGQRRAKRNVSYTETSSEGTQSGDERLQGENDASSSDSARKKRLRSSTRQASSQDHDQGHRRASKRLVPHVTSYEDRSSGDENFDVEDEDRQPIQQSSTRKRQQVNRSTRQRPVKKAKAVPSANSKLTKARCIIIPQSAQHSRQNNPLHRPFQRRLGELYWDTLPFHILEMIIDHATRVAGDDKNSAQLRLEAGPWLAETATVCKHWYVPTVAVLYKRPTIRSTFAAHKLRMLLETSMNERPSNRILGSEINHNFRIKTIELDVMNVLMYSTPLLGRLDVEILVPLMPQLQALLLVNRAGLYGDGNMRAVHRGKWLYQNGIFSALNEHGRQLRKFLWDHRMFAQHQDLIWLASIHSSTSFQSVEELKLIAFPTKTSQGYRPRDTDSQLLRESSYEELLAQALQALPALRSLQIESSRCLNKNLMALLPQSLDTLIIKDCNDFNSTTLAEFLQLFGAHIRYLELSHNLGLSLSFTTVLKMSCPKLQVFRMDLNNMRKSLYSTEAKPTYRELLLHNEEPTWPSSLREVELLYLRHWTTVAATTFFKSLVYAAADLPDLRVLYLRAIISTLDWRQRTAFREEWTARLRRIFLRNAEPPTPFVVRGEKAVSSSAAIEQVEADAEHEELTSIEQFNGKGKGKVVEDGHALRPRRSRRYANDDSGDDDESAGGVTSSVGNGLSVFAEAARAAMESHIQGMCDVVDVMIDNQRPSERQYNESDFLDEAPVDDGEWTAGAEEGEYFDSWAS